MTGMNDKRVIRVSPGQREIGLFGDGHIEIERFSSDGSITDEESIEHLFSKFGDA